MQVRIFYIIISEGQRNDINFAIPVLEQINLAGSNVLADRGYDSYKLIDYIYDPDNLEQSLLHSPRVYSPNSDIPTLRLKIKKSTLKNAL